MRPRSAPSPTASRTRSRAPRPAQPSAAVATSRTVAALTAGALVAALAVGLAGCGDDAPERSAAGYCTEVGARLADLNTPSLTNSDDVARMLASWREVAARAPLAVESDWAAVIANLETASTVDPADPASVQRMADAARTGEPAATRVITYTYDRCAVTIGGVAPVTTAPNQQPPDTAAGTTP